MWIRIGGFDASQLPAHVRDYCCEVVNRFKRAG